MEAWRASSQFPLLTARRASLPEVWSVTAFHSHFLLRPRALLNLKISLATTYKSLSKS